MVATSAFGMGIDKSNVSFVIHSKQDIFAAAPPPREKPWVSYLTERTKESGEFYIMVTLTEPAQRWLMNQMKENYDGR